MIDDAKPILFTNEMVEALLSGRKTETRRMAGLDPVNSGFAYDWKFTLLALQTKIKDWEEGKPWQLGADFESRNGEITTTCNYPYGRIGSKLWVKETYAKLPTGLVYRADKDIPKFMRDWNWKGGIYMPRACSRITLEIVGVRVEQLMDITEEGANAEGFDSKLDFMILWDRINRKKKMLNNNPWVWATQFKIV